MGVRNLIQFYENKARGKTRKTKASNANNNYVTNHVLRLIASHDAAAAAKLSLTGRQGRNAVSNIAKKQKNAAKKLGSAWHEKATNAGKFYDGLKRRIRSMYRTVTAENPDLPSFYDTLKRQGYKRQHTGPFVEYAKDVGLFDTQFTFFKGKLLFVTFSVIVNRTNNQTIEFYNLFRVHYRPTPSPDKKPQLKYVGISNVSHALTEVNTAELGRRAWLDVMTELKVPKKLTTIAPFIR